MAYRIFFYCEGRTRGIATCDTSLDDAVRFARAERTSRGADFVYIADEAGTDVWHEDMSAPGSRHMTRSALLLEQAADCRNQAERARRLAGAFRDDEGRDRALRYAEELEEQAIGLEKQAAASG
jgi:hypothetical protein